MKKLYIIRHAKSSWDNISIPDFDRPLNKRGLRDAPFMGELLSERMIVPEVIISSPALRAKTTAEIIAEKVGIDKKNIQLEDRIYTSNECDLKFIIAELKEDYSNLFLVGHNPAFTHLVNRLGNLRVDNLPTCGIIGIEFNVNGWREVPDSEGETFLFEYPKKYFKS